MKTIALRFGEHFSPSCGTIAAHQAVINKLGYVWYGKRGSSVAKHVINFLMNTDNTKILLISSGKANRYWAHVIEISQETPELEGIPSYYRDKTESFKTWFKIDRFELAPKDIMSRCKVISSGAQLGVVSKHSMNPYFIINCEEKETKS